MRILIVEDEHELARNIQRYLLLENYAVDVAFDGEAGLQKALANEYDCLLLDLNLPHVNGIDICHNLRTHNKTMPILMLTARSAPANIVEGLDSGADDYLKKPFDMPELVARIRALIRRKSEDRQPQLNSKDIRLDTNTREVTKGGQKVSLSPKEYMLLEYLMRNPGRVLERTSLISHVWGAREDQVLFSQTLDVHIAYLRKKLGKDLITTVPGTGYMIPRQENV